jgi:hypothetical protein
MDQEPQWRGLDPVILLQTASCLLLVATNSLFWLCVLWQSTLERRLYAGILDSNSNSRHSPSYITEQRQTMPCLLPLFYQKAVLEERRL